MLWARADSWVFSPNPCGRVYLFLSSLYNRRNKGQRSYINFPRLYNEWWSQDSNPSNPTPEFVPLTTTLKKKKKIILLNRWQTSVSHSEVRAPEFTPHGLRIQAKSHLLCAPFLCVWDSGWKARFLSHDLYVSQCLQKSHSTRTVHTEINGMWMRKQLLSREALQSGGSSVTAAKITIPWGFRETTDPVCLASVSQATAN